MGDRARDRVKNVTLSATQGCTNPVVGTTVQLSVVLVGTVVLDLLYSVVGEAISTLLLIVPYMHMYMCMYQNKNLLKRRCAPGSLQRDKSTALRLHGPQPGVLL